MQLMIQSAKTKSLMNCDQNVKNCQIQKAKLNNCGQATNEVREVQASCQELNEQNSQLQTKSHSTNSKGDALTKKLDDEKKHVENSHHLNK